MAIKPNSAQRFREKHRHRHEDDEGCDDMPARVVLINVFTVDPSNQQRLIDLLSRATDGFVNRAPGFIDATLHRSVDGRKVTMYARWESALHYELMRDDAGPLPFLEEALTFATFEPGMYEAVKHFEPVGSAA